MFRVKGHRFLIAPSAVQRSNVHFLWGLGFITRVVEYSWPKFRVVVVNDLLLYVSILLVCVSISYLAIVHLMPVFFILGVVWRVVHVLNYTGCGSS